MLNFTKNKVMMFDREKMLQLCNDWSKNTLMNTLDIVYTDAGEDFLTATMPVNPSVHQPMGLLHGGASVALAETLGSVAASMTLDLDKQVCVGLEINANHLNSVKEGNVKGVAKPVHLGKSTQVWEIKIYNEAEQLCCISRITMAILDKK